MYLRGLYSHGWFGRRLGTAVFVLIGLVLAYYVGQEMGYLPEWDKHNTSAWIVIAKMTMLVLIAVVVGALGNAAWEAFKAWRERQGLDDTQTFWKNHHYANAIGLSIRQMLLEIAEAKTADGRPMLPHRADRSAVARLAGMARSQWNRLHKGVYLNAEVHVIPVLFREDTYTYCITHDGFPPDVTDADVMNLLTKLGGRQFTLTDNVSVETVCVRFRAKMFAAMREVEKFVAGSDVATKVAFERAESNSDRKLGELRHEDIVRRLVEINYLVQSNATSSPKALLPLSREEGAFVFEAQSYSDSSIREIASDILEQIKLRDPILNRRLSQLSQDIEREAGHTRAFLKAVGTLIVILCVVVLVGHLMDRKAQERDRIEHEKTHRAVSEMRTTLDEWRSSSVMIGAPARQLDERQMRNLEWGEPFADAIDRLEIGVAKREYKRLEAREREAEELKARKHADDNYRVAMAKGRARFDRYRLAEARPFFSEALKERPGDFDAKFFEAACVFMPNPDKDLRDRARTLFEQLAERGTATDLGNYATFLADVDKEYSKAEATFEKALRLDRSDADLLSNYANFLIEDKKDEANAGKYYTLAIAADPKNAVGYSNYGVFLLYAKKDAFAAEKSFNTALKLDGDNAISLGGLATIAWKNHDDIEQANKLFEASIKSNPREARILGNYATFLLETKGDVKSAKQKFEEAYAADPTIAEMLGGYANFMWIQEDDIKEAKKLYSEAIERDPNDANNLGNFATFMWIKIGDYAAAGDLFKRAIEADPKHANTLGNYANFLTDISKDYGAAEVNYKLAIAADPQNANHLGNYARLLFMLGRVDEGMAKLDIALSSLDPNSPTSFNAECWMYAYCFSPKDKQSEVLKKLKHLVLSTSIRTDNWDFAGVIAQAKKLNHPEAAWLDKLAEVVAGRAGPETLNGWAAWQAA